MQRLSNAAARLAAAALLALPLAAFAQAPPPPEGPGMEVPRMPMNAGPRQGFVPMHQRMHGGRYADVHNGCMPDGPGMPPPEPRLAVGDPIGMSQHPLLRGLNLDEAQADKVFAIMHGQAPAARDAFKALRKANQELRALALSGAYDVSKARALANAASRATAELAMLRADAEHRIWDALTEEQRRQVEVIQRPAWGWP